MRKALPCSARLLLPPLQKLSEQRFAIALVFWSTGSDAMQKYLEIALDILLSRSRRAVETLKHLLGYNVSCPPRNSAPEVDFPPLRMAGRDQKLVPMGEEPLGEALNAAVPVASFRPVEDGKNRRHCNRIDRLPIRNERWVVFALEFAQSVEVCKRLRERDWDKMKSRIRWNPGEKFDWLSNDAHQSGDFAGSQFLKCSWLVDQDLLHFHP
jgi:hypothetical protein